MTRLEINLIILEKLKNFFEENPDIRFCQALQILNISELQYLDKDGRHFPYIVDNFHVESENTLISIDYYNKSIGKS